MTKEEAIQALNEIFDDSDFSRYEAWYGTAMDMAIKALQVDMVRCENCQYQDECEEVVLFEVTDDEVIGHRVHWCSYGRSE